MLVKLNPAPADWLWLYWSKINLPLKDKVCPQCTLTWQTSLSKKQFSRHASGLADCSSRIAAKLQTLSGGKKTNIQIKWFQITFQTAQDLIEKKGSFCKTKHLMKLKFWGPHSSDKDVSKCKEQDGKLKKICSNHHYKGVFSASLEVNMEVNEFFSSPFRLICNVTGKFACNCPAVHRTRWCHAAGSKRGTPKTKTKLV